MRLLEVIQALAQRKRILFASAVCLLVVSCALIYYLNTQKTIIIVSDGNKDELTRAAGLLIENNIDARLSKGGTALKVPRKSVDDARLLLATNSVFSPEITFSDVTIMEGTDEKTREQLVIRAKENEIAKSIEAVEGVVNARVLLSLPDENMTSELDALPCASVVLDAPNGLSDEQLNSIAEYISKCVADMKPENVTIVAPDGTIIFSNSKVVRSGVNSNV